MFELSQSVRIAMFSETPLVDAAEPKTVSNCKTKKLVYPATSKVFDDMSEMLATTNHIFSFIFSNFGRKI